MGLVLSIYTKVAFKEFILPSINNADYVITLRENYFEIEDDLQINFEIINGIWHLLSGKDYSIVKKKESKDRVMLEDSDVITIQTMHHEEISIIVKKVSSNFHAYKKYVLQDTCEITIGKESGNDICYDFLGMVSRKHAKIFCVNGEYYIENKSPNGVYVDSVLINDKSKLKFGSFINIIGLHMVFLGDLLAVDQEDNGVQINNKKLQPYIVAEELTAYLKNNEITHLKGKAIYHRAPRKYEKISTSKIEIEFPPALNEEKKQSLFMSIGPSLTMALPMFLGGMLMLYSNSRSGTGTSLYMYSGLVMSVTSAVIGVMWTLINRNLSKKNEIEKKEYRFEAYSEYLVDKVTEIKERYEETIKILEDNYPKAMECIFFDKENGKMWNRNKTHEDFLCHRLGLGNKEFQCDIEIPRKQFSLYQDDLLEKPEFIKNDYRQLIGVPITVDLMEKQLIGIVGGKSKKGAYKIVELLSSQIAFNNCYTDVKLVYIYNSNSSDDYEKWNYAKWFPHVWSEDKKTRFVAGKKEEISDVLYELKKVLRNREDMRDSDDGKKVKLPYYIMFISDASLLEGEEFSKYIYNKEKDYGITTIILADCCQSLPNECDFVIENTDEFKGMYDVFASENEKQRIAFDEIDERELENSARRIANYCVLEVEKGGELPAAISFFEMLHVNRIEEYPVMEMWTKNRTYENIRGLLGQKAGGNPCYLDVHEKYHGPHGLIAGTTGSGKSETLQSYILSLAINYSPDDIGFFIIDYKGGGMANLFEGLPHLIGQISNLSGNQVKRAMISIKSENKRRQRMFVEHGVNNINAYTKMYKNGEASTPIPHLFIVIDEFAELKKEEPEFMKELISVAQVGRSLGLHLILATQKPSGTVDDNIWSNSKFRLCLRVQDQQDSKDMLHKVDAAYITQAGRGYLQVGNDEVYEMFQSGFSGAIFDENMISNNKEIVKLVTLSGKIDISGNSVRLSQKKKAEVVWIDTLCKCLEKVIVRLSKFNKNILNSEFCADMLVKEIYIELKYVTQDYAVNEYNTARLKDFITIYLKTLNTGNGANNAENIIKIAAKIGKKLPQTKEKTQLDVTISYLACLAKKNGYAHKLDLWLPILPETIYLSEFNEFTNTKFDGQKWFKQEKINISVVIGKVDDPENQSQFPMMIDFLKDGNIAIFGNIVSGRSTLMQTIVYSLIHKYDPSWLNVYALDFSSRMLSGFESAPHIGAVMYENDLEKISKFFNMMMKIYSERKELYKGGNYKQYVEKNGVNQPVIIVFIDNYSAFKDKTQGLYEDLMVKLTKDGSSLGIYFVISGTTIGYNDIPNRVSENIGKILCLSLADKYAYGELLHNMQINVIPENGIKGRGLAYFDTRILEYQVALSEKAENDYQRLEKIKINAEHMADTWKGKCARRVPEIPKNPVWSKFIELDEYNELLQDSSKLPVGYDKESADVYGISLDTIYCYLITGLARTGKSNYMKVMIQSAINKNCHVCIIDSPKNEFKAYRKEELLYFLSSEQQIFEYFRDILTPVFQQRNQKKNSMLNNDCDEVDIYNEMRKEPPYFIFISDFSWFVKMIYTSTYEMKGFMETLIAKGRLHNIYFVAELSLNKSSECRGYKMYESFIEYRTGIHFGGRTMENSILPFEYLSYKEQSEEMDIGVGRLPGQSNYKGVKNVVIPMARK